MENESFPQDEELNEELRDQLLAYASEFRDRMNNRAGAIPIDIEDPFENIYVMLEELSMGIMGLFISLRYIQDDINPDNFNFIAPMGDDQ